MKSNPVLIAAMVGIGGYLLYKGMSPGNIDKEFGATTIPGGAKAPLQIGRSYLAGLRNLSSPGAISDVAVKATLTAIDSGGLVGTFRLDSIIDTRPGYNGPKPATGSSFSAADFQVIAV